MAPLCELQERHGVNLGIGYKNMKACAIFVDYISLEQQQALVNLLTKVKFFSLQFDGSTDVGNTEDELLLVVFCDPFSADGKIRSEFYTVKRPKRADAEGLFACLKAAMSFMSIDSWEKRW